MLGKKFTKQMIKWVNINHILSSQICNKNVENHHCKSDLGQKPIKQKKKWVNINHILSSKNCKNICKDSGKLSK